MKRYTFILVVIVIVFLIVQITYTSSRKLDKDSIEIKTFIEQVDIASDNKVQINWKEVVGIMGVLEKNSFENVNIEDIREISNMFIDKVEEKYRVRTLEEVTTNLKFSKWQEKLLYRYMEDLDKLNVKDNELGIEFINNIKDEAINNYEEYNILPSITIAQAILESGWGESELAKKYNNLFGIKAHSYWKGESVILETQEYNGQVIKDKFRKYKDQGTSIIDHGKFLVENERYSEHGVFEANTYKYQAEALEKAGYSTDMNEAGELIYSEKLIELIQEYNLQLIDNEIQSSKKSI